MKPVSWVIRLLVVTTLLATSAGASPPLPQFSEVDPCVVVCPAGDSVLRVVARHYWTLPSSHARVQVDLCGCPEVTVAQSGFYSISNGCWVELVATVEGVADFPLRAGGVCAGASIRIFADGILLATRTAVASPDRDGDLVVEQSDVAQLNSKLGTGDPTADFDCDGTVTAADLAIAAAHLGHSASGAVGVPGGSQVAVAMLGQNWPNPFSGTSHISFRLSQPERVTLKVFDVRGREVAGLLRDAPLGPGPYELVFDGAGLPTGIYLYRLEAGRFVATRRMALLR